MSLIDAINRLDEGRFAELVTEMESIQKVVRAAIQQAAETALANGASPGAVRNAVQEFSDYWAIYSALDLRGADEGEAPDEELIARYVQQFWVDLFDGYEDEDTKLVIPNDVLSGLPEWVQEKHARIHGLSESFVKTRQPHWRERWVRVPTAMEGEIQRRLEYLGTIYEVKREGGKTTFSVGTRWFPAQLQQYLPAGVEAG